MLSYPTLCTNNHENNKYIPLLDLRLVAVADSNQTKHNQPTNKRTQASKAYIYCIHTANVKAAKRNGHKYIMER